MNPIKLLVVDDHYMIVEGIVSLLKHETEIEIIGHAHNAESCMSFLQRLQPDIIFLDINLPDKSGLDICSDIKSIYPAIKIIALSTYNQHSYIQTMLKNGANAYLLKNATKEEMICAIKSVMSNKQYLSSEVAETMKVNNNQQLLLTRREKEILKLIAEGLTSAQIGNQLFISTTTVDTHRKHLLEKLKASNTAILIKTAARMGFI